MKMRSIAALAAGLLSLAAQAEVALPAVFSDHMVLQADMATPVFGTAAADERVSVEINGQKKTGTAGKDGKWLVKLDPMKPGGPFELKVNARVFKDVLVGEVWLASGQSNMRFLLSRAADAQAEMAKADFPQIRYCLGTGPWTVCSPK